MKRKGSATVEFAIVLPLFVALIFGMLEFGHAVLINQKVCNASRDIARTACQPACTPEHLSEQAQGILDSCGLTEYDYSVTEGEVGDPIMATAESTTLTCPISRPSTSRAISLPRL